MDLWYGVRKIDASLRLKDGTVLYDLVNASLIVGDVAIGDPGLHFYSDPGPVRKKHDIQLVCRAEGVLHPGIPVSSRTNQLGVIAHIVLQR